MGRQNIFTDGSLGAQAWDMCERDELGAQYSLRLDGDEAV
jgi:hypothetical protein